MMKVMGLFPTPIAVNEYEGNIDYDFINSLEKEPNGGNSISVNRSILQDEKLSKLNNFILDQLNQYIDIVYKPVNELEVYITQSWVNYTNKNEEHHLHNHPNSLVSGVFYIDANDGIELVNTNNNLSIQSREIDVLNASSWLVPATANKLILFPSSTWHRVPKVVSDKTRISIAFNTFIRGDISQDQKNLVQLVI